MSRRPPPNPAAERAAQNQQTIKSLLKLEPNKICADCKRNKHPRWASWNLGVFVCIRCSGIHRGMGTHISRVKSVDLDSWTDAQLQSVLSWGNARANKYWEAKLAVGHVPSEAKIENFIRTKYELKRWVMDGPMPDPATLDAEGDDDLPLSVVKEKQDIERKASLRKTSAGQPGPAVRHKATPQVDLIGGDDPVPPRASTAGSTPTNVPPKAAPAPARATSSKDSLLGLDFLGSGSTQPPRPASATAVGGSGGQSRPDLKQSILSLYASAPRPQAQSQQPPVQSPGSGGLLGDVQPPADAHRSQGSFGGLNDAFSSLSFGNTSSTTSPPASGLSTFSNLPPVKPAAPDPFSNLSGGSFFSAKPAQTLPTHQPKQPSFGGSGGFGGFASPAPIMSTPAAPPKTTMAVSSSAMGDLFDFSDPVPQSAPAPAAQPTSPPLVSSVFNLSANPPKPSPPAPSTTSSNILGSLGSNNNSWQSPADVWGGGNDAWAVGAANANITPAAQRSAISPPATTTSAANDFGWGSGASGGGGSLATQSIVPGSSGGFSTAPKVATDEEFGGWSGGTGGGKGGGAAGGFGGNEDSFSNVWQ